MSVERFYAAQWWHVEAVHYPTAQMAKAAWERCEKKLILTGNEKGASVFRLSPHDGPAIPSGAPPDAHYVVAVTQDRRALKKAQRLLSDGTSWAPEDGFCDALIARRLRMMIGRRAYTLRNQPGGGSQVIRRDEDHGARMHEGGELREQR